MQQSLRFRREDLGPLLRLGWLSEQAVEFQARIAQAGRWKAFASGQQVYGIGDAPDALYGLAEGALDMALPIIGGEIVTVHRAEPGTWIGDSAALAKTTRSISVTAATDSLLFRVPVAAMRAMLRDHPGDWAAFYLLSHENATLAGRLLAEVLSLPPRARFARMLLRLADAEGFVPITQDALGGLAGMSRASFRRAFADLIGAGAVRTEYRGVRILDRAALEREMLPDA